MRNMDMLVKRRKFDSAVSGARVINGVHHNHGLTKGTILSLINGTNSVTY